MDKPIDKITKDIEILKTDIEQINKLLLLIKTDISYIRKYIEEKKESDANKWFY